MNILTEISEKEINQSISEFKSLEWIPFSKGDDVKEYLIYFDEQYRKCFKNGFIPFLFQKDPLFNSFFRVRKYNEIRNFNSPVEYSYPKPVDCNDIRRANLPGYPVFYCSHHPYTAFKEMEKWNGNENKYVVSKWRKNNIEKDFIHAPTYPEKDQFKNVLKQTINIWRQGSEDYKRALAQFVFFMGDQIIREDDYSVSACLSYKLLYEKNIDVISYPSILNFEGINFAFSPKVINNDSLILDRIYIVELGIEKKITLYRVGIFSLQNSMIWHDASCLPQNGDIFQIFLNDFSALHYDR